MCVIESLVVDEIKQAEGLSGSRYFLYRWLDAESDSHGACDLCACTESRLANSMCLESCDSVVVHRSCDMIDNYKECILFCGSESYRSRSGSQCIR